jgi:phage terminase Nu1 subunit (DNA packaging protein)
MSKLAVDALMRWIAESVRPVPAGDRRKEAERLAAEFIAYAADAGIRVERLEEEIGEDLVSRMEDALEEVSEVDGPPGEEEEPA